MQSLRRLFYLVICGNRKSLILVILIGLRFVQSSSVRIVMVQFGGLVVGRSLIAVMLVHSRIRVLHGLGLDGFFAHVIHAVILTVGIIVFLWYHNDSIK